MSVLRLIDANANRAREGLRVLEDAARFVLGDAALSAACKDARHRLRDALESLDADALALLAHRDPPGDGGTAGSNESEMTRSSAREVVIAAGKRVGEALRAIEEYAKTLDGGGECAARVERVRYASYELEKRVVLGLGAGHDRVWRVGVLVSEAICAHGSWEWVVESCVKAGVDAIQLREKSVDDGELIRRSQRAREITRDGGVALVINDRVDIAAAVGADGVHLGQTDMAIEDARRVVGGSMLIGVSTTNLDQARAALAQGADVCGVGPVFETSTKAKPGGAAPGGRTAGSLAGLDYVRAYADHEPRLPMMLAIGGIGPANVGDVIAAGATGVAVSGCVCGAEDPGAVCRELLGAFE